MFNCQSTLATDKTRARKLTVREERNLVRELQKLRATVGAFPSARLRTAAGISRTFGLDHSKTLKRHGYSYLHSRKKGLLTARDLWRQYQFACKTKRLLPSNFWESGVSFYFDATSFVHKINSFDQAQATKTMAWRKKVRALLLIAPVKEKSGRGRKNGTFFCVFRIW